MKKFYFFLALIGFILFATSQAFAQVTEPGLGLPLLEDETTSTPIATRTTTTTLRSVTTYGTATVVPVTTGLEDDSSTQSAVDDAETGSEVILLAILSICGGVGIFLIKKYFDFKRYSL